MFRPLLLSACLLLPQDAPPAPADDPLEELVKKTNALAGFTAEYRVTNREGDEMHVTLYYEAPDRAAMIAESGKGTLRTWCIGGEMFFQTDGDTRDFARVDLRDEMERYTRVLQSDLRAEFPGAPAPKSHQAGPGAYVQWDWLEGEGGKKPTTKLEVGWDTNRTHACGWLKSIQRRSMKPRETEAELIWNVDDIVEVQISKSSGFITRMHSTDPESKGETVLEDLDPTPPAEGVFDAPESAPDGAQDNSIDMLRGMRSNWFGFGRTGVWTTLAKWIDDAHVSWDDHSPEKLTRVFRSVHAIGLPGATEDYVKEMGEWIDSTALDLASRVSELDPEDESGLASLTAAREVWLSELTEQFAKQRESWAEHLSPPNSACAEAPLSDVFLECERDAIRAEYQVQVIDPLLELFREKTDAALER